MIMDTTPDRLLIEYRYDALDRLVGYVPGDQSQGSRFYQRNRLTTEIQGPLQLQIFQSMEVLLAESHNGNSQVTSLLMTDQHGSVLTAFGTRSAYTPYGHRPKAGGLTSIMGFNGERADSTTGHYLLGNGHRAFNPRLMRFNSPDSLSPFGKGGLNSYAYCAGDPVNRRDPTGKWSVHGWFANALLEAFNEFAVPYIPKRAVTWIPGVGNRKFGRAVKRISRVGAVLSSLAYLGLNRVEAHVPGLTAQQYDLGFAGYMLVSTVSISSAIASTLHKIAIKGSEAAGAVLIAYRASRSQVSTITPQTTSAAPNVPIPSTELPNSPAAGQVSAAEDIRTS
jgi:RHS repeat-associated protein